MSIDDREIICYEYILSIKDIIKYSGQDIYGLDNIRTKIHDRLCDKFKLTKDATKKITDNIDLDNDHCADDLFIALRNKSDEINNKDNK